MKTRSSFLEILIHRPISLFIIIFILTIASYSNTLHSPTVLDDKNAFLESSRLFLQDLSFTSLAGLTDTRFGVSRLVPVLTFALNHYFSNGRLLDYHLTNIFFHLLTFLFFWLFLQKLLCFYRRSDEEEILKFLPAPFFIAMTAGLWVLNPVQTNGVTYIVQRMTSLCTLFYVASLSFYLSGRQAEEVKNKIFYFLLTVVCALGAFMSKENSYTLPVVIIMLEYFFISHNFIINVLKKIKARYWIILSFLILLLSPLIQETFASLVFKNFGVRGFTLWERLLTESRVVIWYISLLLLPLPSRMNLDHDFTLSHSLINPVSTLLSILLIALIIFAIWRSRKKHPLLSFGLFWFLFNLIIESTIIPLEIVFEHRLYLPSMGLFIAISYMFAQLIKMLQQKYTRVDSKEIIVLTLILLFSGLSVFTTLRNNTWFDTLSIYKDCYLKSPDKPRTIANLGLAYAMSGEQEKAREYFREAIDKGVKYNEEYVSSASNIITSLVKEEKYQEAMSEGEYLYKNIPPNANLVGLPTMLYTLGLTYQKNQEPELALESFKEALQSRSNKYKELYIYYGISLALSEIAGKKEYKELNDLETDKIKESYIKENLFYFAIRSRDYNTAKTALQLLKQIDEDKYKNLKKVFEEETSKNTEAAYNSDITNHPQYQNDRSYRLSMITIKFINKHYSPLKFIAHDILDTMKQRYPHDRFVWELDLGINYQDYLTDAVNTDKIDEFVSKYQDFPPILAISAKMYLVIEEYDKALRTINKLLTIYPAHPQWFYWEQASTKLRMKNGKTL